MKIRLAMPREVQELVEVERRAVTAAHWSAGDYLQAIEGHGEVWKRVVLVAENEPDAAQDGPEGDAFSPFAAAENHTLLGFLVARHLGDEWELENVVVVSRFQRQGIGTRLLSEFLARARDTKSSNVFLEVRESNVAARKLYEKAGFRQHGRRKDYYSNPPEDAILYRQDIV